MNVTLIKSFVALIPIAILLAWSVVVFLRRRTLGAALQLLGAVSLLVVVLTHVAEALHLLPFMHWGDAHSAGHYLDLSSAILGVALVPLGVVVRMRTARRET